MGKRANQTAAARTAAKKAKSDPILESIADVIMEADDLPNRCRTMLVETLPFCLGVPTDERHEIQKAAADMVEQVLTDKKSVMQSAVAAEDVKLAELMTSQAEFTSTVSEAEAAVTSQKEVVVSTRSKLAEATTTASTSRTTLTELRAEQKEADANLQSARDEKVALESAFENHFTPMKEAEAGPHFKELEPFLKKLEMEESLLIALPSTCAKSKEHRGTFDNVVVEALETAIRSKLSKLGDIVTAETPASAQRQLAVEAAEKDYEAKKEIQKQAVAEFEAAQKEQNDREATLSKAKQTVLELKPQVDRVTGSIEKAKLMLEAFETGPMAGFNGFSTPPEAAPAGA